MLNSVSDFGREGPKNSSGGIEGSQHESLAILSLEASRDTTSIAVGPLSVSHQKVSRFPKIRGEKPTPKNHPPLVAQCSAIGVSVAATPRVAQSVLQGNSPRH